MILYLIGYATRKQALTEVRIYQQRSGFLVSPNEAAERFTQKHVVGVVPHLSLASC